MRNFAAGPPCHQQLPPGPRGSQRRRQQQRKERSAACGGQRGDAWETAGSAGKTCGEMVMLKKLYEDLITANRGFVVFYSKLLCFE